MAMEAFIFEHMSWPDELCWLGLEDNMIGQSLVYVYLHAYSLTLVYNQRIQKEDDNSNTKIRLPNGLD